jgi:hypothetical protein
MGEDNLRDDYAGAVTFVYSTWCAGPTRENTGKCLGVQ